MIFIGSKFLFFYYINLKLSYFELCYSFSLVDRVGRQCYNLRHNAQISSVSVVASIFLVIGRNINCLIQPLLHISERSVYA